MLLPFAEWLPRPKRDEKKRVAGGEWSAATTRLHPLLPGKNTERRIRPLLAL